MENIMSDIREIYDLNKSLDLTGGRKEIAKDLLGMLITELPKLETDIRQDLNDPIKLRAHLHKLKGSISYCAVPRLKKTIEAFHNAAHSNTPHNLEEQLSHLSKEILLLERAYYEEPHNLFGT